MAQNCRLTKIPRTAPQALFEAASLYPDHIRFIENKKEITFKELAHGVACFADYLRAQGVKANDKIAIFAPNSLDWIITALGTQACGAAFAGVHAGSSGELATHIIENSQAKLLVTTKKELKRAAVKNISIPTLYHGDEFQNSFYKEKIQWKDESSLENTACLIYTSGTTGKPKGAMLTHQNLATNNLDWVTVCAPSIPEMPREIIWLPFTHILGWGSVTIGNMMGFTASIISPQDIQEHLKKFHPHFLLTVPVLLERLARQATTNEELLQITGGEIKLCLSGGAPLSATLKKRYQQAQIPVYEGYGLTETSPTLTLCRPGEKLDAWDTVGPAYPSVELKIAKDGEIIARGKSIFPGYFNNAKATQEVLDEEGWFHTGDLGELTANGHLKIIGRKKELIVLSNGKKITPTLIEAKAVEDPWIERLVVFGNGHSYLVALLAPAVEIISQERNAKMSWQELIDSAEINTELEKRVEKLNKKLSKFEQIRKFAIAPRPLTVEEEHLTPSFKLKRKVIWKDFHTSIESLYQKS